MFEKCSCNHCFGHIEFDASQAGQVVACPHCGLETILFVPPKPPVPEESLTSHKPNSPAINLKNTLKSKLSLSSGWTKALLGLVCLALFIFFGNVHIVTYHNFRGNYHRIVMKDSFGFRETFINVDALKMMPEFTAKTLYPISIKLLRREGVPIDSTGKMLECINNLRLIDAAKSVWAEEHHKKSGDIPTVSDLTPYLNKGVFPTCSAGGDYTIAPIGTDPKCSISDHALP
jgi:DNA-directed RNA polymerase subunit RPC12/RpoP